MASKYKTLKQRIEDKIYYCVSGCWIWTGSITGDGRPTLFSRTGDSRYTVGARASWQVYRGEIPSGLLVCHHCDNILCVNPDHLFLGTNKDNSDDKISKNRHARGSRIHASKLIDNEVIEIRKMYDSGVNKKEIALKFNVTVPNINSIVNRKTWHHI